MLVLLCLQNGAFETVLEQFFYFESFKTSHVSSVCVSLKRFCLNNNIVSIEVVSTLKANGNQKRPHRLKVSSIDCVVSNIDFDVIVEITSGSAM